MLHLREQKKVRESVKKKMGEGGAWCVRQEPTWGTNASLMKEVTMVLLPTPSRKYGVATLSSDTKNEEENKRTVAD